MRCLVQDMLGEFLDYSWRTQHHDGTWYVRCAKGGCLMAQEGYAFSRADGKWQKKNDAEANYEGMTNEAGAILLAYWRMYP